MNTFNRLLIGNYKPTKSEFIFFSSWQLHRLIYEKKNEIAASFVCVEALSIIII